MKRICLLILIFFVQSTLYSQSSLDGKWQGAIVQAGTTLEKGTLFYIEIKTNGNELSATSREEVFDSNKFSVKKVDGKVNGNVLTFKQTVILKSSKSSKVKWCRLAGELKYNLINGYLEGNYESIDCKRVMGKIILYRSDFELSKEEKPGTSQLWFEQFASDLNDGLNAPEIRKIERDNFIFEPIFFDHDMSNIHKEHFDYLDRLIKVVKGHSDLRVMVIGHTDSDGSDSYNDGLSKRRAESIINYFVSKGLDKDRLRFDFKGEKFPVDTNNTAEGKQRNRRVDFEFI